MTNALRLKNLVLTKPARKTLLDYGIHKGWCLKHQDDFEAEKITTINLANLANMKGIGKFQVTTIVRQLEQAGIAVPPNWRESWNLIFGLPPHCLTCSCE